MISKGGSVNKEARRGGGSILLLIKKKKKKNQTDHRKQGVSRVAKKANPRA